MSLPQTRPLTLFFVLAYAWTWTIWLAVPRIVHHRGLGQFDSFDISLIIVGACGPTIAAFLTQWLAYRNFRIGAVWTGWRIIPGLVLGIGLLLVVTVIAPAVALAKVPIAALHWDALIRWRTYDLNYSTFIGGPINEEPGWRGFALPKLGARFGELLGSVILGVLWAGWHTPLLLVPGWWSGVAWQYFLVLTGVSLVFTVALKDTRFSILVAIMLHAFFNISTGLIGALTAHVPTRQHDNLIYSVVLFSLALAIAGTRFRWNVNKIIPAKVTVNTRR